MKKRDIVNSIPGGWYGNNPGFLDVNPKCGNVVVDAKKAVQAISWLNKRAMIVETGVYKEDGLMIQYQLK